MTVNCAASAMWLLPDTVVRKHCSPARSQQAAASAEAAGDTVLVSTHSVPARAKAASCAATLSSAASPGNDEKTMSTPGSASCASITLRPRSAARACCCALVSLTLKEWPARCKCMAMGKPILPTPTK